MALGEPSWLFVVRVEVMVEKDYLAWKQEFALVEQIVLLIPVWF
jgi:hypothetical protein